MKLHKPAYRISTFAVSPDGKYVASGDVNGDVALWDIQSGKMNWKIDGHKISTPMVNDNWVWSAAFTSDSKGLLTGGGNRVIKLWDVETGIIKKNLEGHGGSRFMGTAAINAIVLSSDGKKIVSGGADGTVQLWDVEKGMSIKRIQASTSWAGRGMVLSVDISPDGKYSLSSDGDDTIKLWDNETGYELLNFKVSTAFNERWLNSVVFAKNGTWAISGGCNLRYWDLKAGTLFKEIEEEGCGAAILSVSKDGKLLLASGGKLIKLRDLDSGQLLRTYQGSGGHSGARLFDAAVFHPIRKWIVTRGYDASVRIKDMDTDEEIALLVGFSDGEWIVVTSEGYYNSSEKGAQYLSVKINDKRYSVDSFYDVFYRPDIVAAKLRGDDIKDLITITMKAAIKTPPPSIEFTSSIPDTDKPRVKVCYQAKSTGGGIGEVRLFHNGKLIESDGYYREVAKTDKNTVTAMNSKAIYDDMRSVSLKGKIENTPTSLKTKGDIFEDCKEIDAVSGENEISVAGFNKDNTIQSAMKTIKFNAKIPAEEPHLYILAIGINDYKDKTITLKYASKDAKDIEEKLLKQAGTIYKPQNIHYQLLKDTTAAKMNITNKINELSQIIKPADSFILFVAGHGVLLQNQYYILTSDYNGNIDSSSMISSNEIVEMSRKIKSLSQLFIFDTCHAGGVDTIISGLYDARMSVLAKKMGLHIYASANSFQQALDGYQNNGLFTHTLLDGLNNKKEADKNKDNAISLIELGEYTKQTTTEISKTLGHQQTPLIINFGKDSAVYNLR